MKNHESSFILGKTCLSVKQGFTLIELLMVIAIIGILSSVTLVSTQGAVEKSKRAAAITSASSVLPELVICQDDDGKATNSAPVAGNKVCCKIAACNTGYVDGHTAVWPDISKTGWAYYYLSGDITDNNYIFTLTKTGQTTIRCSMATNGCS